MTGPVTEDRLHPDERALLQGIRAQPEDDAARLVYADWLDEHGQHERAEIIRVQCALARLPETAPNRESLVAREQALLKQHSALWCLPLAKLGAKSIDFERGFPSAFRIDADDLVAHASELFAATPIISLRVEKISALGERFPQFVALPQLGRLTSLSIHAGLQDSEAVRLAACSHLAQLTKLDLAGNRIGVEGCHALAASAHLRALRSLRLTRNQIDDDAVRELVESPNFASLRVLDLSVNQVTDIGGEALAGAKHLSNLDTLDLSANPIGNDGVDAIAHSTNLAALRWVHLHYTAAGPTTLGLVHQVCGSRATEDRNRR